MDRVAVLPNATAFAAIAVEDHFAVARALDRDRHHHHRELRRAAAQERQVDQAAEAEGQDRARDPARQHQRAYHHDNCAEGEAQG